MVFYDVLDICPWWWNIEVEVESGRSANRNQISNIGRYIWKNTEFNYDPIGIRCRIPDPGTQDVECSRFELRSCYLIQFELSRLVWKGISKRFTKAEFSAVSPVR